MPRDESEMTALSQTLVASAPEGRRSKCAPVKAIISFSQNEIITLAGIDIQNRFHVMEED